jgi:tetratricopeptide (TPR) repeat protein
MQTPAGLSYGTPGPLTAMTTSPMPGSALNQLRTPILEPSTSFPSFAPSLLWGTRVEDIEEMVKEAELYVQSRNETMAEAKYREALSGYEKLLPSTDDRTLEIAYRLADLYASQKMMEKADEVLDQMNRKIVGQRGLSHQKSNVHFLRISNMYRKWGREADARILIQRLVETRTHTSAATPFASLPGIPVPSIQSLLRDGRASTNIPRNIRSSVDSELKFFEKQLTEMSTVDSLMMLEPEILATMETCKQNLAKLHIPLLEAATLLMELSDSVGKRVKTEVASSLLRRVHEHSESACLTVLQERVESLDLGAVREIIAITDKLIELRGDRGTSTVQRLLELLSCRVDEDFADEPSHIVITYVHITHMYASRKENDAMKIWLESALSRSMALLSDRCTLRRDLESILKVENVADIDCVIRTTVEDLVIDHPL